MISALGYSGAHMGEQVRYGELEAEKLAGWFWMDLSTVTPENAQLVTAAFDNWMWEQKAKGVEGAGI